MGKAIHTANTIHTPQAWWDTYLPTLINTYL